MSYLIRILNDDDIFDLPCFILDPVTVYILCTILAVHVLCTDPAFFRNQAKQQQANFYLF